MLGRVYNRGASAITKAAFRSAQAAFYRASGGHYIERRIHDYKMVLDLHDPGISRALNLFGTRELDHKFILEKFLHPGMRVFDIGSNIGYYPLLELQLTSGMGNLICIEPVPENVELLRRNLELNGWHGVPIINAAVSNKVGNRILCLSDHSNLGSFHPINPLIANGAIQVETITIPQLAAKQGWPDLIRMDVEGHEVEILEGALDGLSRHPAIIVFETHLDRYTGRGFDSVLRALFHCGYHISMISSATDETAAKIAMRGYTGIKRMATDATYRTLFENIRNDDAIDLICHSGGVRTAVLAKLPR